MNQSKWVVVDNDPQAEVKGDEFRSYFRSLIKFIKIGIKVKLK